MLSAIVLHLYERMPRPIQNFLRHNKILKGIRSIVLRNKGLPRQITVPVNWNNIHFQFYAPLKIAEKAKNRGIENTLLRNSIDLLKLKKEDAIVFDVGANYGFLSMVWAKSISSNGGKVFSFEPHPQVAKSLQKTVTLNNLTETIQISNVAVGETQGIINMYLYGTTSNVTARSIEPQSIVEVEQITLDSFVREQGISNCDLIKIDTDGSELSVLKGALLVIEKYKPLIIVETNGSNEVLGLLKQLNYSLLDMNLTKISDRTIPPNVFAIANNRNE